MAKTLGLAACVLLLCGVVGAETVTVCDTMDYTDNGWGNPPYFLPPGEIVDHSPYHGVSNQDWGWTHDFTALVPKGATGIESASVVIEAWDVDSDEGEDDIIYANGVRLGMLTGTIGEWSTTAFELPHNVLDDLWRDGQVDLFMDIDANPDGFRVTLDHSTVRVGYTVGQIPEPTTLALLGLGGVLAFRKRRMQEV